MKITVPVKLNISKELKKSLIETMKTFNEVCNGMSCFCFEEKVFKQFNIHKIFYYQIRECYDLPSQLVIRAISKVADAYKKDKKTIRTFRDYGAIAYDARILTWKEGEVSISTQKGRKKVSFVCGKEQRENLKFQKGESDLVYKDGNFFLYATCEIKEPKTIETQKFLGVDLGIANIANDSLGNKYSGAHINSLRKRHLKLRRRLQSKGTKSAKRLLKKRNRKEQRFSKDVNHKVSKRIVETAQRHSMGISLENLEGIRQRATVRKKQRYSLHSWSFYDLRQKIWYKARLAGIPVVLVDPKYTSQECSKCHHIEKSNRKSQSKFSCNSCGYTAHADYNAACVISSRAVVNRPYVYGANTLH